MVGDQGGLPPEEVILDRVQPPLHRKAHLDNRVLLPREELPAYNMMWFSSSCSWYKKAPTPVLDAFFDKSGVMSIRCNIQGLKCRLCVLCP